MDVSSIADVACTNSIGHWLLHSLCKPLPRRQQVQFGDRLSWRKCHSTGWEEGGEGKGGEGKGRHRASPRKKIWGSAAAAWPVVTSPANALLQPGSSRGNERGLVTPCESPNYGWSVAGLVMLTRVFPRTFPQSVIPYGAIIVSFGGVIIKAASGVWIQAKEIQIAAGAG